MAQKQLVALGSLVLKPYQTASCNGQLSHHRLLIHQCMIARSIAGMRKQRTIDTSVLQTLFTTSRSSGIQELAKLICAKLLSRWRTIPQVASQVRQLTCQGPCRSCRRCRAHQRSSCRPARTTATCFSSTYAQAGRILRQSPTSNRPVW